MGLEFGERRAIFLDIAEPTGEQQPALSPAELGAFTEFDLIYRSLCSILFNYVPMSGHPGGSISSGRFVACLLFDTLDYDFSDSERPDADIVSYAAGHKALGLYAMWALRNEIARVGAPELLPTRVELQLRLEDLLGFRRNPVTDTPLFRAQKAKALDGHPTPATPFVRLATGASGVGLPSSLGLAMGAADYYGQDAPRVHIVEGEGGLTPGRAAEALAAAGTASLGNVIMHLDWNQAAIDTDHVCREDNHPGEYVQWTPAELAYLNDWNVINVPDGTDLQQVAAAQRRALDCDNGQPTVIIYRTTKGWRYGIEGKASHGAGHGLCSADFYETLTDLEDMARLEIPRCDRNDPPCGNGADLEIVEKCFWEALLTVRGTVESRAEMVAILADRLRGARERLVVRRRGPRPKAPRVEAIFEDLANLREPPDHLRIEPGGTTTLRGELGRVLDHCNRISDGALMIAAADLLGSTSVAAGGTAFAEGYGNRVSNQESRLAAIGGICEDAISAVMSGLSSYGRHIGVGASYGAFMAPLGHIASRLHLADHVALDRIGPRSRGQSLPFSEGPLPRQRSRPPGARGGRPRRSEPVRGDQAVHRKFLVLSFEF